MLTHMARLMEMAAPDAVGLHHVGDRIHLADGAGWAEPWAWAGHMRRALGARARLFGFWSYENPSAHALEQVSDHHAFAIVDGRYLVDGWSSHVMGLSDRPVLDLQDPQSLIERAGIYGSPHGWEPLHWLEEEIDREPDLTREAAMRGLASREKLPTLPGL